MSFVVSHMSQPQGTASSQYQAEKFTRAQAAREYNGELLLSGTGKLMLHKHDGRRIFTGWEITQVGSVG